MSSPFDILSEPPYTHALLILMVASTTAVLSVVELEARSDQLLLPRSYPAAIGHWLVGTRCITGITTRQGSLDASTEAASTPLAWNRAFAGVVGSSCSASMVGFGGCFSVGGTGQNLILTFSAITAMSKSRLGVQPN